MKNIKFETKISKDIFTLFSILNMVGYNDENNKKGMHIVRKRIRSMLENQDFGKSYTYFKKNIRKIDPWYFICELLKKYSDTVQIKISTYYFILNFRKASQDSSIKKLWQIFKIYHLKEAKKLFSVFKTELTKIMAFTNKSSKNLKKIILIPNLLDAFWRGYGFKIQNIGYIVVGPGAKKNQGELIRHEFLHILAPQYHIPARFLLKKDHSKATKLGYGGQNIIRKEYTVIGLNLLYESIILKKNIKKDIIRETKYFPHIRYVIEIIKKQL
ncbi:MAG: hypothetical protein V1686_00505 [Patescibacteria group bacterium]